MYVVFFHYKAHLKFLHTKKISIDKGIFVLFLPFFSSYIDYLCYMAKNINIQTFYIILTKFYDGVKKVLKFWWFQLFFVFACACACACATPIILKRPHHIKETPLC